VAGQLILNDLKFFQFILGNLDLTLNSIELLGEFKNLRFFGNEFF
jgi:hypothetical protein